MINIRVTSTIVVGRVEDKFETEAEIDDVALMSDADVIGKTFAAMVKTINGRTTCIEGI